MSFQKVSVVLTAITLGLTGCVSTSKYKKLQSDVDGMKTKNASLQEEVAKLELANADLNRDKANLQKSQEETQNQYGALLNQLQSEVQQGELKITQYKNMLTVDIAEKIFFDSGSAKLKKSGQVVLKKVGQALAGYKDKVILVSGHTDAIPMAKSFQNIFPTNWELSVLRATNVVRFLQDEGGIAPESLIASGRSQYAPVAPNDTAEGRQKNRRIEISLLDKALLSTMQEGQPSPTSSMPPAPTPAASPTATPQQP